MEAIKTSNAPAAIGPYSQAIRAGNFLFCSGQIPLNPETMVFNSEDVSQQTVQVLKNLKAVLSAAGTSWTKVMKTTVFLTDLTQFDKFNAEYQKFLEAEGVTVFPARSTIQVSKLPKGAQVEVEAIANL